MGVLVYMLVFISEKFTSVCKYSSVAKKSPGIYVALGLIFNIIYIYIHTHSCERTQVCYSAYLV